MGEVRAIVKIRNYGSVWAAEKGFIKKEKIPFTELDMLVDTGAVLSMLPQDEVEKLELLPQKKVVVTYADDRKEERFVVQGVEITIGDRSLVTDAIIGPPLSEPLLGQVVLEELDLLVDTQSRRLIPRPESPNLPLVKLK